MGHNDTTTRSIVESIARIRYSTYRTLMGSKILTNTSRNAFDPPMEAQLACHTPISPVSRHLILPQGIISRLIGSLYGSGVARADGHDKNIITLRWASASGQDAMENLHEN